MKPRSNFAWTCILSAICIGALGFTAGARADVDLRSGEFSLTVTDTTVDNGSALKIERHYHSRAQNKGIFGWGWGTEYETFLTPFRDGSILVHDAVSGTVLRLSPSSPAGGMAVTKSVDGYRLRKPHGIVEFFDTDGRLQKISGREGNDVEITYDEASRIVKITDSRKHELSFVYRSGGLVARWQLQDVSGKKMEGHYRYNDEGDLLSFRNAATPQETYRYDDWHSLTEIGYPDHTSMQVLYMDRDQGARVMALIDREGSRSNYVYQEAGTLVDVKDAQAQSHAKTVDELFGEKLTNDADYSEPLTGLSDEKLAGTQPRGAVRAPAQTSSGEEKLYEYDAHQKLARLRVIHGRHETVREFDALGHVTSELQRPVESKED